MLKSNEIFFRMILKNLINKFDGVTPYTSGSPASHKWNKRVNADDNGDTHLWAVWHGLKPYNYYRKRMTRFCSEFGFESMPDYETILKFAKPDELDITSKTMQAHQKMCFR